MTTLGTYAQSNSTNQIANKNFRPTQETPKENHDECVRFKFLFAPGEYMFIEWPSLSTSPDNRLAAEGYTELLSQRLGPYPIISVGPKYIEISQD